MTQSLNRDGILLAFHDTGVGDPPLVFVPGWTCDRSFVARQVERFLAISLPAALWSA